MRLCVCVCVCVCRGPFAANGIGDEGARALAEALRNNSALQTLSLDSEPFIPPRHPINDAALLLPRLPLPPACGLATV